VGQTCKVENTAYGTQATKNVTLPLVLLVGKTRHCVLLTERFQKVIRRRLEFRRLFTTAASWASTTAPLSSTEPNAGNGKNQTRLMFMAILFTGKCQVNLTNEKYGKAPPHVKQT
jgi:hypothetical protein